MEVFKPMNGQNSTRLRSFDIAKGIGMLCIIAGHLGRKEIGEIVFSFHVPLFFFISGYFYRIPKSGAEALAKRAQRLLVPYVMCAVLCALGRGIALIFMGDAKRSWAGIAKSFLSALYGSGSPKDPTGDIASFGAIWFLLALFWALTLYDAICEKKFATPIAIALFAVGVATRKWWLPLSIQPGMSAVVFLHIGYVVHKRLPKLIDGGEVSYRVGLIALVIWLVSVFAVKGHMSLVKCYFPCIPVDFLSAMSGTLVVMWISGMLARVPVVSDALTTYGANSLTTLCFHMFDMRVIPWQVIVEWLGFVGDASGTPLYTACLFLLKVLWGVLGLVTIGLIRRIRSQSHDLGESQSNRIRSFDIAKGIAILLVVMTHQSAMDPVVRKLVFAFHMPFFFLANAAFVSTVYDVRKTFRRSLRTLLLPYAVVCLLQVLLKGLLTPKQTGVAMLHRLQAGLLGVSYAGDLLRGYESVSLIWFVACLFVARNIYVVCRRATLGCNTKVQYAIPLALCVFGWWLGVQRILLPWSIDVALFAQVFMLLGDEARRHGVLNKLPSGSLVMLAGGVWVALATGGFQIEMATRNYPGFVACIAGACAGSLLVCWLSEYLDTWAIKSASEVAKYATRLFVWLGRNSMVILAIHCLRRMWANWSSGSKCFITTFDWVGNACIEILFCVAVCFVFCRAMACIKEIRLTRGAITRAQA